MIDSCEKIYKALELAFESRRNNLGKKIIKDVKLIVQDLKELDIKH